MKPLTRATILLALIVATPVIAGPRGDILAELANRAKAQDATFSGFDAEKGKAFFHQKFTGGKPGITSCTVCHTDSPRNTGHTRASKEIAPMAVSKTPERFTDPDKIAKWFRRNCKTVLGRECTAREKGDYITFMSTQ